MSSSESSDDTYEGMAALLSDIRSHGSRSSRRSKRKEREVAFTDNVDLLDVDPDMRELLKDLDPATRAEVLGLTPSGNDSFNEAVRRSLTDKEKTEEYSILLSSMMRPLWTQLWTNIELRKQFSDVSIAIVDESLDGRDSLVIPANKIVLYCGSTKFKDLIEKQTTTTKSSDNDNNILHIKRISSVMNYEHNLDLLLGYLYTGIVKVEEENVYALMEMATIYGVEDLKEECGHLLGQAITSENVFHLLDIVKRLGSSNLEMKCSSYLAAHFGDLLKEDRLKHLDPQTWVEMLKKNNLKVNSEKIVLEAILRYAEQYEEQREDILQRLLPFVQWTHLPPKYLIEKVENNDALKDIPLIHHILFDTYRCKAVPQYAVPMIIGRSVINPRSSSSCKFSLLHKGSAITLTKGNKTASLFSSSSGLRSHHNNVVCTERWITEGKHKWNIKIDRLNYIGVGLVSPVLTSYSSEFHNIRGCCVYYYSGPVYSNYPDTITTTATKQYTTGDIVTILLNVDESTVIFQVNGEEATRVACPGFGKFKLGVLLSPGSTITLIENWELEQKVPK